MLTKLDGDARGGAALSIRAVTGNRIKVCRYRGEKLDNIEVFIQHSHRMASRILGNGQSCSLLIEKAEQTSTPRAAEQDGTSCARTSARWLIFTTSLPQLKSMGSMADIASMIPEWVGKNLEPHDGRKRPCQKQRPSSCLYAEERENPSLLNSSRKKRIAAGSVTQVVDINRLAQTV
jgi:signal recognition particle subunit SRP54